MKANEMPERVYLFDYNDAMVTPMEGDTTYVREDAFIEKAEKFFTEKFEVEDYNDNIDIDGSPIFNYGRFIDDFKNYMKGD